MTVDADGNVYVAGLTYSTDYPGLTPGSPGGPRLAITKVRADGQAILFTFGFSAGFYTGISGMVIDLDGRLSFGSFSAPPGMPVTPGAIQPVAPGAGFKGFFGKLEPTGRPVYLSYLGGPSTTSWKALPSTGAETPILPVTRIHPTFP